MSSRVVKGEVLSVVDDAGGEIFSLSEVFDEPKATIGVRGKITLEAAHDFEDELTSLVTVCKNVVIDFSETEYVSSDAMQCLLGIQRRFDSVPDASLVIKGLTGDVKQQFKDTGFLNLFQIEE